MVFISYFVQPSINLTLVSDDYILPWSTNSTLLTTMDWGSRIVLVYDFNDTNPNYQINYDRFYPNTAEHHWNVEGTFYPTVCCVHIPYSSLFWPVYSSNFE